MFSFTAHNPRLWPPRTRPDPKATHPGGHRACLGYKLGYKRRPMRTGRGNYRKNYIVPHGNEFKYLRRVPGDIQHLENRMVKGRAPRSALGGAADGYTRGAAAVRSGSSSSRGGSAAWRVAQPGRECRSIGSGKIRAGSGSSAAAWRSFCTSAPGLRSSALLRMSIPTERSSVPYVKNADERSNKHPVKGPARERMSDPQQLHNGISKSVFDIGISELPFAINPPATSLSR